MVETLTGAILGAGGVAVGFVALTLLATKFCPVCEHMFTKGVERCRYCLHEFN